MKHRRTIAAAAALLAVLLPGSAMADDGDGGYPATVRLTYYVQGGTTYGGGHTYPGSAACSWNFALGTAFALPDGSTVVCNDRGMLGSAGWLDVYGRPDMAAYGPYARVWVTEP